MRSLTSERRLEPDSRALNGPDPMAETDLPFGAAGPAPAPGADRITVGASIPALDEFAQIRVLTPIAATADGVVWNGYRYTLDNALTVVGQLLRAITVHNDLQRKRPAPPPPPVDEIEDEEEEALWKTAMECLKELAEPWIEEPPACS